MRVAQAKRLKQLEGERRSDGAGGGRPDGRQPGLCGKRPEGDLSGPDASGGGRHAGAAGVGGLGGAGPAGCWANPGPGRRYRARVPDNRGGALGPRELGPAPWASVGTATGGSLPCCELRAGRSTLTVAGRAHPAIPWRPG